MNHSAAGQERNIEDRLRPLTRIGQVGIGTIAPSAHLSIDFLHRGRFANFPSSSPTLHIAPLRTSTNLPQAKFQTVHTMS